MGRSRPLPGEENRLVERRRRCKGAKAGEALTGLDELLGGSEGALAQLRAGGRARSSGAVPIILYWPKRWPASTAR